MVQGYNVDPEYVRLVPSWEAAATIFCNNLLYGSDKSIKQTSMNELIKMGSYIDQYNNKGTIEDYVSFGKKEIESTSEGWDCQP